MGKQIFIIYKESKNFTSKEARAGISADMVISGDGDHYPDAVAQFDTLDEAREAFKQFSGKVEKLQGFTGGFYEATVYFIEEFVVKDDELDSAGNIWDITEI